MRMNLIGLEGVDYTKSDGQRVVGIKAHVTHGFAKSKQNVKGLATESIWISSNSELFEKAKSFPCPAEINVEYEIDGRFSRLSDINIIKS